MVIACLKNNKEYHDLYVESETLYIDMEYATRYIDMQKQIINT